MDKPKTDPRLAFRNDNQDLHDRVAAALSGDEAEKKDNREEKKDKPKKKIAKLKGGKSYSDGAIALAVKKLT